MRRGDVAPDVSDALTIRIDPHVHSEASYDAADPVELLLEQAAEIGLDAIVVTDHDVIHESLRAADLAPEYGLVGIPGVEVSTADGHMLAVGVEEMPPRRRPLDETAAWVRDHGGVSIVPHPFQRSRHGVRKRTLRACVTPADADTDAGDGVGDPRGTAADGGPNDGSSGVDAVEVYNSWLFTGYKNRRARRFSDAYGVPGVAGSDAHTVPYVGRAYTELAVPDADRASLDAETILDAVRDGATRVQGRRQPIPLSAKHYSWGAARKSGYYAKVGALKSGYYAKVGALKSGYYAKTGAVRGAQLLSRFASR